MVNESIHGCVEFCFYRRGVRRVSLCGEFNDWHQTSLPMKVVDGGWWRCRLRLAPGSYRFKYLADKEWFLDYAAFGLTMGPQGAWDSVVLIREEPDEAEPRQAPLGDIAMPRPPSQVFFGPPADLGPRHCTNETTDMGMEVLV